MSKHKLTEMKPSLPKVGQEYSLLCCLPSDIRWLILRELLVSPEILSTREGYTDQHESRNIAASSPPNTERTLFGYHLSPSILRTCQFLFREGLRILYSENTLCIRSFHRQQFPQSKLGHVKTSLYIPTYKEHHPWYSSTCCYVKYDSFYLDHQCHKFARKFQRFKFIIDPEYNPDLFRLILSGTFEVLESVFRGASVHLAASEKTLSYIRQVPAETAWSYTLLSCGRYSIDEMDSSSSSAKAKTILNFSRKEKCPPPRDLWPRNAFWKTLYVSKDGAHQTKGGLLSKSIFDNAWSIARSCIRYDVANITDPVEREQRRIQLGRELSENISKISQEWEEVEMKLKSSDDGGIRYWWKLRHTPGHAFM